jgi:hypothetical protein
MRRRCCTSVQIFQCLGVVIFALTTILTILNAYAIHRSGSGGSSPPSRMPLPPQQLRKNSESLQQVLPKGNWSSRAQHLRFFGNDPTTLGGASEPTRAPTEDRAQGHIADGGGDNTHKGQSVGLSTGTNAAARAAPSPLHSNPPSDDDAMHSSSEEEGGVLLTKPTSSMDLEVNVNLSALAYDGAVLGWETSWCSRVAYSSGQCTSYPPLGKVYMAL